MTTITIPKELTRSRDLVAVPKQAFEEFSAWQKKTKSTKGFTPTVSEKKALIKARKNFSQGKYTTLEKIRHELAIDH